MTSGEFTKIDDPEGTMTMRRVVRAIDEHFDHQPPAAVIVIEGDATAAYPHVIARGDATSMAMMARTLLLAALDVPRPTDCPNCQHNYDLMWHALAVLDEEAGRCDG